MTTSPRSANLTMLRAISEIAVAMRVRSVAENPTRAAISRPFCRATTTSASLRHGHADLAVRRLLLPPFEELGLDPCARRAAQDVAMDVELPLTAPVPAGQRPQDRSATVGRRLDPLGEQQVLHPQPGPGAAQLRGDRSRRRALARGQRDGVLAVHLVRHQDVPVAGRQPGQRGADHRPLLLTQHVGDRGLARPRLQQQVRPAARRSFFSAIEATRLRAVTAA